MPQFIESLVSTAAGQFFWLCGLALAFGLLARAMPCNPGQGWRRPGIAADLAYYFVMPLLGRFVRIFYLSVGVFLLFQGVSDATLTEYFTHGFGPLGSLPVWLQAAIVFLVSDVYLYWMHRWFHGRALWPYHAIHHSSAKVDWLSTWRFHPVNTWLEFTSLDALVLLAGFSPESLSVMAAFNIAYSAMVHANLNWTFGPLRYVLASPVFHRWHHTTQEAGIDKNFAPTFPLLDLAFGTFYMPEGEVPTEFGVRGKEVPHGFLGQLVWPFRQTRPEKKSPSTGEEPCDVVRR